MSALANLKPTALAAQIPSAQELIDRAHAMIPMLRERADQVEQDRKVSSETIQAFVDAGFFKILQPRQWGGWEMNPEVFFRVLMELGRGCCSSAWNMMILGVHQWEFGHLPQQAGDDVWGQDNAVIVASAYAPAGSVTPVEGGFILDGLWPTSSGTDHGQWAFLGGFLKDENGVPYDRYSFLISRDDYEIVDDWFVFGLKGTGSKSLRVNKAFIPAHRAHSMALYEHSDRGSMYYWPFSTIFFGSVSAVICGFGQGAIDIFSEQMKVRTVTGSTVRASLSPYVRDRLGNATVKVSSARARLLQIMAETTPVVSARELVDLDSRVRHLCEIAHVGRNVEEAVLLLFKATGARGIFLNNPLQRVVRDVLAAANHITQNADDTSGVLGGHMLGADLPPLMFAPRELAASA
jgi:3-hydroxy-9,10-secoandrosta-1,3,5(10)-triene-9,17-dione monooxygenase